MLTTALLAALAATVSANAAEGARAASGPQGASSSEAAATASVRIHRGFRLTPASARARVPGARSVTRNITDADGVVRTASLVEFE